jgi:hypothetical protein
MQAAGIDHTRRLAIGTLVVVSGSRSHADKPGGKHDNIDDEVGSGGARALRGAAGMRDH